MVKEEEEEEVDVRTAAAAVAAVAAAGEEDLDCDGSVNPFTTAKERRILNKLWERFFMLMDDV